MVRHGYHLRPHKRTSVHGLVFRAGRGSAPIKVPRIPDKVNGVDSRKLNIQQLYDAGYYLPFDEDYDGDKVQNVIDRRPVDSAVDDSLLPHISMGNGKLQRSIANWSIMPGAVWDGNVKKIMCPGATKWCLQECKCYALRGCKRFPSTKNSYFRNYWYSTQPCFVELLSKIIREKKDIKYFRIHVAGDFYNQEYLEKWKAIARNVPNVTFLAFTKSLLDYANVPSNLTIRFSLDTTSPAAAREFAAKHSLPVAMISATSKAGEWMCRAEEGRDNLGRRYGCCPPESYAKSGKYTHRAPCIACWDKSVKVVNLSPH